MSEIICLLTTNFKVKKMGVPEESKQLSNFSFLQSIVFSVLIISIYWTSGQGSDSGDASAGGGGDFTVGEGVGDLMSGMGVAGAGVCDVMAGGGVGDLMAGAGVDDWTAGLGDLTAGVDLIAGAGCSTAFTSYSSAGHSASAGGGVGDLTVGGGVGDLMSGIGVAGAGVGDSIAGGGVGDLMAGVGDLTAGVGDLTAGVGALMAAAGCSTAFKSVS